MIIAESKQNCITSSLNICELIWAQKAYLQQCDHGKMNLLSNTHKSPLSCFMPLCPRSHWQLQTSHTVKESNVPLSGGAASSIPKGWVGRPFWMLGVYMSASTYIHFSFLKHLWTSVSHISATIWEIRQGGDLKGRLWVINNGKALCKIWSMILMLNSIRYFTISLLYHKLPPREASATHHQSSLQLWIRS